MNVSLTVELEKFVNAGVQTGRYNSASEVVREALRFMEERDQARAARLRRKSEERRKSPPTGVYATGRNRYRSTLIDFSRFIAAARS